MRRPEIRVAPIREAIEATLEGEKRGDSEVSVLIVNDARIRELNRRYRAIDTPTDVLAFAMGEGDFTSIHPELLGDIIISVETAAVQAARTRRSLEDEVCLLAVHGTLHLLGYEDETASGRAFMQKHARKYLKRNLGR